MSEAQGLSDELAQQVRSKYALATGAAWLLVYLVLASLLLLIGWMGHEKQHRGVLIELGVALGAIGLAMMGLQALFGGRSKWVAPSYGMDNILQFHKEIGIIATLFVLAHPVLLIIGDPSYISFFDPRVNLMRSIALIFVVIAVPAVTLTSIWRKVFNLSYENWRLLHGFLGLAIVFVGVVHTLQVSHYMEPLWKKIGVVLFMGACMYVVVHSRLVRPHLSRSFPYRVKKVVPERGDAYTMQLEPMKGDPLRYIPGQFVWITIGPTPYSLQQHPFSITSSARSDVISLTAKQFGDFTSTWKDIPVGTPCYLEGPYGSFTPIAGADLFLIMGGIGITPAMSMLRTMRDDGDGRKVVLLYANKEPEEITFREELDALAGELDLQVVHVLEELPEGWPGVEARIDKELIGRYLPRNSSRCTYYICGPGGLMDAAEEALRDLDVPWQNIYSERFEIV